jgi:hypothetical protein
MTEQDNKPEAKPVTPKLHPTTQKVIENCINEVLGEYTAENKYYTADTLHFIRSKITEKVHSILGKDQISSIDVILDLNAVEDVKFGFKINIPQDKAEAHILNSER